MPVLETSIGSTAIIRRWSIRSKMPKHMLATMNPTPTGEKATSCCTYRITPPMISSSERTDGRSNSIASPVNEDSMAMVRMGARLRTTTSAPIVA